MYAISLATNNQLVPVIFLEHLDDLFLVSFGQHLSATRFIVKGSPDHARQARDARAGHGELGAIEMDEVAVRRELGREMRIAGEQRFLARTMRGRDGPVVASAARLPPADRSADLVDRFLKLDRELPIGCARRRPDRAVKGGLII